MNGNLFRVFLWKNWLFLKFSWISILTINLGCFLILAVYLRSSYNLLTTPSKIYDPRNTGSLKDIIYEDYIFYSPSNQYLDDLMENVRIDLQLPIEKMKAYPNASDMIFAMEHKCKGNCFAIEFKEYPENEVQRNLKFAISSTAIRLSPQKKYVNDEDAIGIKDDDEYIRIGFLTLQHVIDMNVIKMLTKRDTGYEIEISPLPSIALETLDSNRVIFSGSLYSVLFSVILLSTFLVPLIEEKQDGIKEFLVLATPWNFLNSVTFFFVRLIVYIVFFAFVFSAANMYNALGIVPFFYIILLYSLYILSTMSYTYLISVCFNSVFYAKVGGLILMIIPYIFFLVKGKLSTTATFLLSTKTFLDGLDVFQIFTNKHRFFSYEDLFENITDTSMNMFTIYIILICQCLVYLLLYNYLTCIFPGPGGLKKPYFFFLKDSFYKRKNRNQYNVSTSTRDVAIIIQDLMKEITTKKRRIIIANRLNMEVKDKRITVLLGHNGVGKTTTMNMIMGSVPKDSGKIIVCSERNVSSYRHLIGFCPQHSVFMHYMTCFEHLKFFAQLRGKSENEAKQLAHNLLEQLGLLDKANEPGKNLSGGMKRRLSLGIALSGDTRIVILDEPSSGLDIESRRQLWDILLELRKTKAVLVTTHHMEEAEVLGDTISILANGRLERTGTPMELKRKVGCGYILKIRTRENFNESDTLALIQRQIPTAKVLNTIPPTVLISMPYGHRNQYSSTLLQLEKEQNRLGISGITVTDTSLEDVFLNCAAEYDQVDCALLTRTDDTKIRIPYQPLSINNVQWSQQFRAVYYKKFTFISSEWLYSLVMFSLPFLCIGLAILLMHSMSLIENEGALKLNLNQIKSGTIYVRTSPKLDDHFENLLKSEIQNYGIEVKTLPSTATTPTTTATTSSFVEELQAIQSEDVANFLQNAIGAIDVEKMDNDNEPIFKIYYSGNIVHSSVIMVNLVDNIILKYAGDAQHELEAHYAPIRRINDVNPSRLEYFAAIVPIGMFFYMFFYISLPFQETKTGFKNIQAIPSSTYWFSFTTFDLLSHGFLCVLLYIFQRLIMPIELYSNYDQLLIIYSLFFYGLSYLPLLYCMASAFRSISTLSTYLLFMLIVSAIVPLITSGNILSMLHYKTEIAIFSILPDFNLNHQLRVINENFFIKHRNGITSATSIRARTQIHDPLMDSGIFFLYAVTVFIIVELFLIYVWENKSKQESLKNLFSCYNCRPHINKLDNNNTNVTTDEEALVREEKIFVEDVLKTSKQDMYPLLVSNLHKFYNRTAAVCGLSFAVKRQECFGLLGVNGAGKTTTFQMITANSTISSGFILIDGVNIHSDETKYKYRFGYCPQSNCLNNFMTAYQILKYMAFLRGIPNNEIHSEVISWLTQLDLLRYQNVCIHHFSGGTKRKLNAAIAMIGNPSLVLLDEPTTGVDPVSRRFLWKCIQDFQKRNKTVVLTSHSMDECEQLCNRLAIMANGQFQCIGYVQDLKQKYGSGFTIKVKMKSDYSCDCAEICEVVRVLCDQFEGNCDLRENHAGMLTFFVQSTNDMAWSMVFEKTEQFLSAFPDKVEDYSVNESTLEDIFLRFEKNSKRIPNCSEVIVQNNSSSL